MKLAHDAIVLVVDGSQMLLLRNGGDAITPDLQVIEHSESENLSNLEILSDAPGLSFASAGFGRDTYDKADPHRENEDRFVADAAKALAQAASEGKGDLIVAAPPTALGVLRKHYTPQVKERLVAEIAKDFTNHPVEEITRLVLAQ